MTQLRVALLGTPRVDRGGSPVVFDTRKATALLAYLAVTARPHSRDSLAGLLWPEYEQVLARGALRRTLSVLNSATGGDALQVDRSVVALRADRDVRLDVTQFRYNAAPREHAHPDGASCPRCTARLEAASAIYRDDFMAGFTLRDSAQFDDWQAFQAQSLRQQLAGVLSRLVHARVQSGALDAAIDAARRWLALDPLNEPAHAMLMRLYAWTGERSTAMRQYRECVQVLHRELGVAPLSETTALDEMVRTGRLARPHAAEPILVAASAPAAADAVPIRNLPMVGRTRELTLLAGAGPGRLVVLSGEAGIGKSRLLSEVVTSTTRSGASVAMTQCHQGEEGLAFGVAADLMRAAIAVDQGAFARLPAGVRAEASRLLPELAAEGPPPPPLDSPGAQGRFYAALVGTLCACLRSCPGGSQGSALLAVEDVHWIDDSSAEVLAYLARRLAGVPLLMVLTWRSQSVPPSSPLHGAVSDAVRDGRATVVDLQPLDQDAVAALAAVALPAAATPEAVRRLWRETGGLPMFVTEYLEAFRRGGGVPVGEQWRLPGGVADLLRGRLTGLSETALQVLAAAAVLNSDMSPALVRATSGRGEDEVVTALEEAAGRALVVERDRDGGTYEFSHDAMRRLVYDTTSLARRRLLHSRAADALAQRRDRSVAAATVAAHLRVAGRDADSGQWSLFAAEQARALYAHTEALDHLAAAASLGYGGHLVHAASGEELTALGRYREALTAYEQAAAACPQQDSPSLAWLEHRMAEVHHRLGSWDVADSHLRSALDLLAVETDAALHARVLADIALVAHRRGDASAAAASAQAALEMAASAGDDAALAQAHDVLGVLAAERGDIEPAERHLRESLRRAARLADPGHRVAAGNNLALLLAAAGRMDEAITEARAALQLGLEQGDRHRAAALHTNLADLLHATGRQPEALAHLTSAARLFAGVDDEELRRPEIWKLARW